MKTPPLLLGAALVLWGWLTGYAVAGVLMATVLEGSRLVHTRWDLSNDDFRRIWVFCTLLFLGAAVYAFTSNEGVADFRGLFQSPNFFTQRNAGTASARTFATLIRWTPMIFCLFVAAQAFSSRSGIPLETISLILAWRWKKARKLGQKVPASRMVDVSYPYFGVCLVAASIHSARDTTFFWGLCALLTWALWAHRSRRFGLITWGAALLIAIGLGHLGQGSITRFQRYLEGFDPKWLSAFARRGGYDPSQSRTSLGQIGRVKASGKIVIRLEPAEGQLPPQLLREASYRGYKAQTWDAGSSKSDFENVPAETNMTTWLLLPQKTNHSAVNIACYLHRDKGLRKGLLPLPEGSSRLERLPAYILQKNSAGAVLAEGPGLVIFDALYGPGKGIDSEPTDEDRAVPPKEDAALSEVVSDLQLEGKSRDEAIKIINRFFQTNFTYSLWQEFDFRTRTDDTPLSTFLRHTHRGHCEYFATATVLLLRKLNIPARYAVGYSVHEASGRKFVVRERDAHAWCLVWNERRKIWQDFDTTPASWVAEEAKRASSSQWLSDAWSRIWFEISKIRWGQTHLRKYLLWSLAPILGLLLYQIISRARKQRRSKEMGLAPAIAWPGLDSEFYQLERKLSERGVTRAPGEPPTSWLQRAVTDPGLAPVQKPLQQVLRLHYRYRFDPQGLDRSEREALRREAKACLETLALSSAVDER